MVGNNQKGFTHILILLFVILITGIGVYMYKMGGKDSNKLSITSPNTISSSSPPTSAQDKIIDKFPYSFTLPEGWIKTTSVHSGDFEDSKDFEAIILQKGNYELDLDPQLGTGRAVCKGGNILNNPNSKVKLEREIPEKNSKSTLNVCSEIVSGKLDVGTKQFGYITYYLPKDWDQKMLDEMDSIVESIH